MDLLDTPEEAAFRAEARDWLDHVLPTLPAPPEADDLEGRRAFDTAWQRRLFDAGYAGLDWPVEAGGQGRTPTEHLVFLEEAERAGAPDVGVNFVGLGHAGPTLNARGTSAQKEWHLPRILRGEEVWCQLFSEPDAGSDLASLRTRARRVGDHYVVSGQKVWTSYAQVADRAELLARTGDRSSRHRGITWLILDMRSPGIEVRPITTIEGTTEFAEVFLDDVRVPVGNRVGEENDGWAVTMLTLSFERGTAFVSELVRFQALLAELAETTATLPYDHGRAWDSDLVRSQLGVLSARFDGLWALIRRNVSEAARDGTPAAEAGTVVKLAYTEALHELGDLAMSVLGERALGQPPGTQDEPASRFVKAWTHAMAISIAAGTSQIQRNIIGERVLGLPREPRPNGASA